MRNSERCAKEGSFSSPSFFTKGLDLPGKNQPRRSESVRRIGGVYVLNRGQGQRLFPSTQGQSCYVKCYYWGIAVVVQERGAFSVCPSLLFNRTCLGRTIYVIILKRDPTKATKRQSRATSLDTFPWEKSSCHPSVSRSVVWTASRVFYIFALFRQLRTARR